MNLIHFQIKQLENIAKALRLFARGDHCLFVIKYTTCTVHVMHVAFWLQGEKLFPQNILYNTL